jgi:hypothetical protein
MRSFPPSAAALLLLCSCGSSTSTPAASAEGGTDGETTADDSAALDAPLASDQTADVGPSSDALPGSSDAPSDAPTDTTHDAPRDAIPPGDAGGSSCSSASGCRTYSSYCGACTCLALAATAPNPACDAGTVSCLVDPCSGHSATCTSAGSCALQ